MKKYLGIDFGKKRTGISISKDMKFAWEYSTLEGNNIEDIIKIIHNENIDELVIGLPLGYDGEETEFSKEVRSLTAQLKERIDIPIHFVNEEMTSYTANDYLISQELTQGKIKKRVDQLSAKIILQIYLDNI